MRSLFSTLRASHQNLVSLVLRGSKLRLAKLLILIALSFVSHSAARGQTKRVDQFGDALPEHARTRMGTVRFRHICGISAIAYSKDGTKLAAVGGPGLSVWNAADGTLAFRAMAENDDGKSFWARFWSLAYSPDGELLAAAEFDRIHLFDARTHEKRGTIVMKGSTSSLMFTPNSKALVWHDNESISFWDRRKDEVSRWDVCPKPEQFNGGLRNIAISPDGKTIYGSHPEGVIRFDIENRTVLESWKSPATKIFLSPNGALLALINIDLQAQEYPIHLHNAQTGVLVRTLPKFPGQFDLHLAFSPDGRTLMSRGEQCLLEWNVANGRLVDKHPYSLWDLSQMIDGAYSPDGETLAVAVRSPAPLFVDRFRRQPPRVVESHSAQLMQAVYHPDEKSIATTSLDGDIRTWDPQGRPLKRVPVRQMIGGPDVLFARALAFDAKGERFLMFGQSENVYLCDGSSFRVLRRWERQRSYGSRFPFAPDGKHFVTSGGRGQVFVWHVDKDKPVAETIRNDEVQASPAEAATFLADGKTVIFYSDAVYRWSPFAGAAPEKIAVGAVEPIDQLDVSGDGKVLAVSDRTGIHLWNLERDRAISFVEVDEDRLLGCHVVSHEGRLLAYTVSGSPAITIRDVDAGKNIQTIQGHTGDVNSLAFSRDGRRLLSSSGNGTAMVWEVVAP